MKAIETSPPSARPAIDLPHDIPTELSVLATLLEQPNRLVDAKLWLPGPEAFYRDIHAMVYRAMLAVDEGGTAPTALLVYQQLRRQGDYDAIHAAGFYLQDLRSHAMYSGLENAALFLRELWVARQAIEGAYRVAKAARVPGNLDALQQATRTLADTVASGMNISPDRSMDVLATAAYDRIIAATQQTTGLTGVSTGLGKLNRRTGGWQPDDKVLFAGRPGAGKTSLLLHCAKSAALAGQPVAIWCYEMTQESMTYRLMSTECRIPYGDLRRGKVEVTDEAGRSTYRDFTRSELARIAEARDKVRTLPIWVMDNSRRHIEDISQQFRAWQQRHGITLAVLDYLQDMKSKAARSGDAYQQVTAVCEGIVELNNHLKVPLLVGSQLSRDIERRGGSQRPGLSDMRDSGKIEEIGSVVLGLYRDDYYKAKRAKEDYDQNGVYVPPVFDNTLEVELLKNRNGGLGILPFWCDIATGRFADEAPVEVSALPRADWDGAVRNFSEPNTYSA